MKSDLEMMSECDTGGDITTKIKKRMALLLRELAIMEKLAIADDSAEKAWRTAQALDARLAKMADALRRSAGHLKDV